MNSEKKYLFWVDCLKAFAILGILLNHFVESFGSAPWFSYPSYNWPDFSTRITEVFPTNGTLLWKLVQFVGWLGDMGPGVFIILSGFTLALSTYKSSKGIGFDFYRKRLVRIFPLYIVIHLITLLAVLVLTRNAASFAAPQVLLSLLGLRFTDGLFFYINPSWWFIWLIIQLYILFPFLLKYLESKGIQTFIFITLGFTLLSRLAGLLNITYSHYLEYWMTGIFFGTRLFEFAAGMILAKLYFEKRFDPWKVNTTKLFFISLATYGAGFICSLFYATTLISSILITIGLSGLFLSFSKFIELFLPSLTRTLIWIGVASFPVFLFHQPVMLMIAKYFSGNTKVLLQGSFLVLAIPAGWLLGKTVDYIVAFLPRIKNSIMMRFIVISLTLQILLNAGFFITQNNSISLLSVIFFIINIFLVPLYVLLGNKISLRSVQIVLYAFIPASVIFLFVLTSNWFSIFWIFIIVLLAGIMLMSLVTKRVMYMIFVPGALVLIITISVEGWLRKNHPIEVNHWGELPVLQKDSLSVFSLIPNKVTHLKYNNYDYYVNTNSLGFNGPEADLKKDSNEVRILIIGDAFTMPEGTEYENAYPELLQIQLRKIYPTKKIKVINAGVTGYGPNEMYGQLKKYIDKIKPDIYINQFFINEFEEINLNAEQRWNSIGLRKYTIREKCFAGCQLPDQIKSEFHILVKDKIYLTYIYNKSLAYFYERSSYLYSEENINKISKYLTNVKSICEKENCNFLLLYAPGQLEVSSPKNISYFPQHVNLNDTVKYNLGQPMSVLRTLCYKDKIHFLNPVKILREDPVQPVYYNESWHWNPEGHKAIADYISNWIQNNYLFDHKQSMNKAIAVR